MYLHFEFSVIMVLNAFGKISLYAFVGGIGVLALFLPSVVSSSYRDFVVGWWPYILTLYSLLAIVATHFLSKEYKFKVNYLFYYYP